jgi:type II secretory pathway pseudopilin PulG
METQTKTSAKDFFINLGAIVALYTTVFSLVNLLFTVIDTAYPKVTNGYNYMSSASISWPVATIIIFFPVFILLMWLLEKQYKVEPERKNVGVHKWLTYITLFLSGLLVAGDLITVLYYFLDGQDLTTGFLLKILVLLIIAVCIFVYYISDVRDRLTAKSRIVWRILAGVIVIVSIVWGFYVLGSPASQRQFKYDEQKVNDLMNINNAISSYYDAKSILPRTLDDMSTMQYYMVLIDAQTQKPYEYIKTSYKTYNLCAEFNKDSKDNIASRMKTYPVENASWTHPAGRYCFEETISAQNPYLKPTPIY